MRLTPEGIEMYESLEEMISAGIESVYEYEENYYLNVRSNDFYSNTIWGLNKNTGNISRKNFVCDFILTGICDKAKEINPAILKRAN